jgi:hypothetical protein
MKNIFLLLGMAAALGACKKSDDSPSTSRTELLTAKNWRLSTVSATVGGLPVPSSYILQDCTKDDFYKFNADKTLIQDAGAIKCSTSDPQTLAGTWSLNGDQSKLTIAVPNSLLNGEADIRELSANTLRIYGTPTLNGAPATFEATFVPN